MAEREAAVLGVIAEPADQSEQSGQSGVHLHPADCDHPGRCPGCNLSGQVIKRGRVYAAKGKTGRYRCGRCGRTFVRRGGFEDMRKPDRAILRALNDFFKGHSPAAIADTLEGQGCRVHPATICKWIVKLIGMAHAHLRTLPVRVGERFCADGVFGTASSRPCLFSATTIHGPDKRRTITGNAAWRRGRYREATWRGHPHGAAPRPGGARRPAPPRAIQGRRLGHAPPPTINAEESPPKNSYKYFNLGIVMSSLSCPECDADINIPADSVSGEIVACQDCGQSYELYESEGNFSLKIAETVGEDWGE